MLSLSDTSVQLFYWFGLTLRDQDYTTRADPIGRCLNAGKFADTSGAPKRVEALIVTMTAVLQNGGKMCSRNRRT